MNCGVIGRGGPSGARKRPLAVSSTSSYPESKHNLAAMGIGSYFKAKKPDPATPVPMTEKPASARSPHGSVKSINADLQPPQSRFGSSRTSISNRSTQSSTFLDDIKHEVMVNYLYQQQCSQLWVSDGSGEIEGVLLRKSKNTYMACPPQLGTSAFAAACSALNVQVRNYLSPSSSTS